MTALPRNNPSIANPFAEAFDAGDFNQLGLLYHGITDRIFDGQHGTANIVVASTDWDAADPTNLQTPEGRVPSDMGEALRWAVLIDEVDGCDSETSLLLWVGERGEPHLVQIGGPAADGDIAKLIVGRDIGTTPAVRVVGSAISPEAFMSLPKRSAANDNAAQVPLPAMHPDPFTPEAAGGLLADISRWITSTAIIPVPELSLAASIALMGGIFGRVALTPTKAGANIYLTTLLGTAGGKGHPPKAIRAISDNPGMVGSVTNGDPTSYAALERILRKNSSTVVVMDEFGLTLQDVNAKHRNSVAAGIRKFLLAVYDQSNSVFDGRVYASSETKKNEDPIKGPALTVLGMTTVETLYAGLSEASVADGFLNRFLFVTASRPVGQIKPPKLDSDTRPPRGLVSAIQEATRVFPASKLPGAPKFVVPFDGGEDGEAYRRWGQVFIWQQTIQSEIAGRAAENTVRLATIRAISRDPAAPSLTVEDVEWGWSIVHRSIELIESGIEKHMAASPAEALRKAILGALAAAPDNTLPHSHLLKRKGVRGANIRELADALGWVISAGDVEDVSTNKYPAAGSKYRLTDKLA